MGGCVAMWVVPNLVVLVCFAGCVGVRLIYHINLCVAMATFTIATNHHYDHRCGA